MGWIVGIIISILMFIVEIITMLSSLKTTGSVDNSIIAPCILTIGLSIFFIKKYIDGKNGTTVRKKEEKLEKEKATIENLKLIPGTKERNRALGSKLSITPKHMSGLPLAEGAFTTLYLCDDKVIFEKNETTYELFFEKVTDVTIKTDVEIQKAYVSSTGGAIAGASLFGPLGAMVGGRTKKKENRTVSSYLIFAYSNDGETNFISFDVTGNFNAHKFVEAFDAIPRERKNIEL